MRKIMLLTLTLTAGIVIGQALPPLPEGLERDFAPRDAAEMALRDLVSNVPAHERQGVIYVWDNCGMTAKSRGALNFTVNAVMSRSANIFAPFEVEKGRLLRYNLYALAPRDPDFRALWREWNNLADFDAVFREPAERPQAKTVYRTVPPYLASDGRTYDYVVDEVITHRKTQAALGSGGAGPLLALSDLAGGNLVPVVAGDWFIATAWGSVTVDGIVGRYYQLRGIQVGQKNDFDKFLESVGTDPKLLEKLRSDQRTVMLSDVAKRFRRIDLLPSVGVRAEFGPSYVTVTRDISEQNLDASRDALENLLDFKDQAREIIAALPNGLHAYLLTNGEGVAQAEVPPDVASWPHSPHGDDAGGTKKLIPGIACLECHGQNNGYNKTDNYVRAIKDELGVVPQFDFAKGKSGLSLRELVDRLDGLYQGEFDLPLKVAGEGFSRAADRATQGAFGPKSVPGVTAEIFRIYREYFAVMTTEKALRSMGYRYKGEPAGLKRAFNTVLPPRVDDPGRLLALRINRPITRANWNQLAFEMLSRDALRPQPHQPLAAPDAKPVVPPEPAAKPAVKAGAVARVEVQPIRVQPAPAIKVDAIKVDLRPPQIVPRVAHVGGQGLLVRGRPYAPVWMGADVRYMGQLDAQGQRFFTISWLRLGQDHAGYDVAVGTQWFKVDLSGDRQAVLNTLGD